MTFDTVRDQIERGDLKYVNNETYVRVNTPNEPRFISLDEIVTKKDVVKLIDVFGDFVVAMYANRYLNNEMADLYVRRLSELKEELTCN